MTKFDALLEKELEERMSKLPTLSKEEQAVELDAINKLMDAKVKSNSIRIDADKASRDSRNTVLDIVSRFAAQGITLTANIFLMILLSNKYLNWEDTGIVSSGIHRIFLQSAMRPKL